MYKLKKHVLPEGETYSKFIRETYINAKTPEEIEEAKELIFRLTYPWALNQLKKMSNMGTPEEFVGAMSVAFMKTFNSYDPHRECSSFLQYYRLAIRCEVINEYYGRYRGNDKDKALLHTAKNLTTSLDEPVFNKDTKETGTKADLLVEEEINFTASLEEEDTIEYIKKLAKEAVMSKRHKKVSEDVYMIYIDLLVRGKFETYTQVAKIAGKSLCNVRRIIVEHNEILANMIKERGLFNVK